MTRLGAHLRYTAAVAAACARTRTIRHPVHVDFANRLSRALDSVPCPDDDDVAEQETAVRRALGMPANHPERLIGDLPPEQEHLLNLLDTDLTERKPL